jgi:hypothetical protein
MNLPGGGDAIVDIAKLRDYCLDSRHPRGRHKARVFAATLGRNPMPSFFGKSCFARRGRPMRWWASLTNMATASP